MQKKTYNMLLKHKMRYFQLKEKQSMGTLFLAKLLVLCYDFKMGYSCFCQI